MDDTNTQKLWKTFERWLATRFPEAKTIATPFNDPIAHSIDEYQSFLRKLGFASIDKAAFGKSI